MIEDGKYVGTELELFEKAHNWKSYFKSFLSPYLKGDVLEVGAGIGGTTALLCDGSQRSWLAIEPDPVLAEGIEQRKKAGSIPSICKVAATYLSDLPADQKFDAILYIDVIEHIENDTQELEHAYNHLRPGGFLLIVVPAHQFLYSPFDKKIGHFRRYSRPSLRRAVPKLFQEVAVRYLDSVGLLASLANKVLLRSSLPTPAQIKLWDNRLVPISRFTDKIFNFSIGKSVLGVWTK